MSPVTANVDARAGKFELVSVRRRDVRRLREFGPPVGADLPPKHGGKDDPRYPSPHNIREILGFTADLALHLACAVGAFVALARGSSLSILLILLAALGTFTAVSILHRIVAQRIVHTTLGKSLVGLRLIRDDTGGPPTLWSLTKAWLWGTVGLILTVISG